MEETTRRVAVTGMVTIWTRKNNFRYSHHKHSFLFILDEFPIISFSFFVFGAFDNSISGCWEGVGKFIPTPHAVVVVYVSEFIDSIMALKRTLVGLMWRRRTTSPPDGGGTLVGGVEVGVAAA